MNFLLDRSLFAKSWTRSCRAFSLFRALSSFFSSIDIEVIDFFAFAVRKLNRLTLSTTSFNICRSSLAAKVSFLLCASFTTLRSKLTKDSERVTLFFSNSSASWMRSSLLSAHFSGDLLPLPINKSKRWFTDGPVHFSTKAGFDWADAVVRWGEYDLALFMVWLSFCGCGCGCNTLQSLLIFAAVVLALLSALSTASIAWSLLDLCFGALVFDLGSTVLDPLVCKAAALFAAEGLLSLFCRCLVTDKLFWAFFRGLGDKRVEIS